MIRNTLFIATIALFLPLFAFSADVDNAPTRTRIRLSINVLHSCYARGESGGASLNLGVELRFTNVSRGTVILLRDRNKIAAAYVSKTVEDARAGHIEGGVEPVVAASPIEVIPPQLTDASVVRLKPGGTYRTQAKLSLPIAVTSPASPGYVAPGSHVLSVLVHLWPLSEDDAVRYHRAWRQAGYLLTDSLRSDLVSVVVGEHPRLGDCEQD